MQNKSTPNSHELSPFFFNNYLTLRKVTRNIKVINRYGNAKQWSHWPLCTCIIFINSLLKISMIKKPLLSPSKNKTEKTTDVLYNCKGHKKQRHFKMYSVLHMKRRNLRSVCEELFSRNFAIINNTYKTTISSVKYCQVQHLFCVHFEIPRCHVSYNIWTSELPLYKGQELLPSVSTSTLFWLYHFTELSQFSICCRVS